MKSASTSGSLQQRALSPDPNQSIARIYVRWYMLQPNIFRKRILRMEGNPRPGDWVAVYAVEDYRNARSEEDGFRRTRRRTEESQSNASGRREANGCLLMESTMGLPRLLLGFTFGGDALPNQEHWENLIDRAVTFRTDVLKLDSHTDSYRVIHGESDGFLVW